MAGDRPLILSLALYIVLSLLYTTLGGLGSIMMLGSIVLPIMISLGITPLAAGCILLFSVSVGGVFNLTNWSLLHQHAGALCGNRAQLCMVRRCYFWAGRCAVLHCGGKVRRV